MVTVRRAKAKVIGTGLVILLPVVLAFVVCPAAGTKPKPLINYTHFRSWRCKNGNGHPGSGSEMG